VTVLLAVYNGQPYIRECVASVLAQTFSDFEFLIVDDASTDGTADAVASFRDPRIRLLRNDRNLGQVAALNVGLREARGELVARIDADDWCRPRRLERQVAALDAEPDVALVGSWMELVEGGRRTAWLRATITDYVDFVYHTLIMRVLISHPAAMFRLAPVLELGGYDEATGPSGGAEDKDLWRRLALARWDARIVPESLLVYRVHEGQLTQTRTDYQRRVDCESQERFLDALSPSAPVRALRLLLAADPAVWGERTDETLAALDRLLADATTRLRLDDQEAARLEQRVAERVLAVARSRPWSRDARTLASYGLRRIPPAGRKRAEWVYAASFALSPLRDGGRRAGRVLVGGVGRVPLLRALRGPARRSRVARFIYGKVVGSS
jgi:glycosyltransferase involved in cell wall biosynthesis